ncbi:MAG: hypothetical protein FD149_502 [Rhodospirillaceae bacterium]|nr:MAG: hypothetical protein FD149_502 [Rhodospirillaceae bacterium]
MKNFPQCAGPSGWNNIGMIIPREYGGAGEKRVAFSHPLSPLIPVFARPARQLARMASKRMATILVILIIGFTAGPAVSL